MDLKCLYLSMLRQKITSQKYCRAESWNNSIHCSWQRDGQTEGWTDRRMDRQKDGLRRMDRQKGKATYWDTSFCSVQNMKKMVNCPLLKPDHKSNLAITPPGVLETVTVILSTEAALVNWFMNIQQMSDILLFLQGVDMILTYKLWHIILR